LTSLQSHRFTLRRGDAIVMRTQKKEALISNKASNEVFV
jgi:hypothetical protein